MDARQLSRLIQNARGTTDHEKVRWFLIDAKVIGLEGRDEHCDLGHRRLAEPVLVPTRGWYLDPGKLGDDQ